MNNKPTIIVTGATRGLGLHFCKYISKLSWNIILVDISKNAHNVYDEVKDLSSLKNDLKNDNQLFFFFYDLTKEKNVVSLFKKIKEKNINVNGLVNFAGGDIAGNDFNASGGKPKNNNIFIKSKDFHNVYNRNFLSTYYMCKEFINSFKKKKDRKKIVNISSISGTYGVENEYAYSSSKSSVIYLTRSLALFGRKHNINVNCIAPCGTTSGRFLKTMKLRGKKDRSRLNKKGLEGFASSEDISKVVYFFLSDLSNFVSGQILRIDGGENSGGF